MRWIGTSVSAVSSNAVSLTTNRRTKGETADDDLRSTTYRAGPSCISNIGCCPSRRFGVAVSPVTYRARTSLSTCSNDEADT